VNLGEPKEGALGKRVGAFWGRFMGWETIVNTLGE